MSEATNERNLPVATQGPIANIQSGPNATIYTVACVHKENGKQKQQELIDVAVNAGCDVFSISTVSCCFTFIAPPGCLNPLHTHLDDDDDDVLVQSQEFHVNIKHMTFRPQLPPPALENVKRE